MSPELARFFSFFFFFFTPKGNVANVAAFHILFIFEKRKEEEKEEEEEKEKVNDAKVKGEKQQQLFREVNRDIFITRFVFEFNNYLPPVSTTTFKLG